MDKEPLLAMVRNQKRLWVEVYEKGDMQPTIFAIRDNQVIARITAPQMQKTLGLKAAAICREGLCADAMLIILDSHVYMGKMTEEEYRKRFPPGSMQKMCDEQQACEKGLLSDCLIVQYHSQTERWMQELLYDYHPEFKWTMTKDVVSGDEFGGRISHAMQNIINFPCGINNPVVQELTQVLKLPEKDTYLRLNRAGVRALCELGYMVLVEKGFEDMIPSTCNKEEIGLPNFNELTEGPLAKGR